MAVTPSGMAPASVAIRGRRQHSQSTLARRMRATALICLGAGAGLIGSELRRLRGEDVI
jgi:hypothetical protein